MPSPFIPAVKLSWKWGWLELFNSPCLSFPLFNLTHLWHHKWRLQIMYFDINICWVSCPLGVTAILVLPSLWRVTLAWMSVSACPLYLFLTSLTYFAKGWELCHGICTYQLPCYIYIFHARAIPTYISNTNVISIYSYRYKIEIKISITYICCPC